MNKLFKTIVMVTLAMGVFDAVYADAAAGKAKSAICGSCHGANGISPNDIWPNLAGQKRGYLVKNIKAFRDGVRTDPMMSSMVKTLSDEDINDLADYYSSL